MTKGQILEILRDVFVGYRITEGGNSSTAFSKILINKKIGPYFFSVFTYNLDENSPESV